MRRATTLLVLTAVYAAASAGTAAAQTANPVGYVSFGVGAQPQRRTIAASDTFRIYDETATVAAEQRIRNGSMFDVGVGMYFTEHLAAGLGYTMFGRPGTAEVTAAIPNPSIFNKAVESRQNAEDLNHKEQWLHVRLSYVAPVSDSMEVVASVGPSFVRLQQDVATSIAVTPGTQNFTVNKSEEEEQTFGFNAGVDANYLVTTNVGVGIFVHYLYGKLDLPSASGFTVGGVQGGLSLRVRF